MSLNDTTGQANSYQGLRIASPQHRLGGYALDAILAVLTCGIGWIIWSLVIWKDGLTPAKQILKMRVISKTNFKPATWGNMAIRQFLLPYTPSVIFFALAAMLGVFSTISDPFCDPMFSDCANFSTVMGSGIALLYVGILIIQLVDAIWIFTNPERKRVVDVFSKTVVVNEAKS